MSKCPYCSKDLHLEDFFEISTRVTRKGKVKVTKRDFSGEYLADFPNSKMWACPSCDTILGFTEWYAMRGS